MVQNTDNHSNSQASGACHGLIHDHSPPLANSDSKAVPAQLVMMRVLRGTVQLVSVGLLITRFGLLPQKLVKNLSKTEPLAAQLGK